MLHLLPIGLWLLCIKLSKGTSNPYGNRGGGSDPEPPKAPSPQETTQDVLEAHLATDPQMAQSAYDIATNPQYGASAWTKMYEDIRRQQYPEETNVRDQLTQNVLQNLVSPTGISPEQQSALDARRGEAYGDVQTGVREAANLGGKLYGGQRIDKEVEARTDLSNLFATEDINRDERSRLNAILAAIPLLQLLYPGSQVTPPQFQSAAPSGDTAFSTQGGIFGSQLNAQTQQYAANQAMLGSLFQGLGGAAGSYLGTF